METRRDITKTASVNGIRQALYASVGWTYRSPGDHPDILASFEKWRLVASKTGPFELPGTLTGLGGNGQAFRIANVTAPEIPGQAAGFKGVIVSFTQAQTFTGRTIIAEDKGVYNPTSVDLMTRVPFQSETFEKVFEVYSDSRDEAERIITSGFIDSMTVFSQETLGRKLQSCLMGSEVHFALDIDENFSFAKTPDMSSRPKMMRDIIVEAGSICVMLEKLYCIQASIGQTDTAEDKRIRLEYYRKCLSKMMERSKTLDVAALAQGQAA